jgi:hypothetical protein
VIDFMVGLAIAAPVFWLFTKVLASTCPPHRHRLALRTR